MKLVISCLGFAIFTDHSDGDWEQLGEIENAVKYGQKYLDSIRPFLARRTFLKALQRRDYLREKMKVSTKKETIVARGKHI